MVDSGESEHPHRYERFRRWPVKLRYHCVVCGLVTRHYDSVDGMGTRPIHDRMTVAVKGFNVVQFGRNVDR